MMAAVDSQPSLMNSIFDAAVRSGLAAVGGRPPESGLSILIFHRVLPRFDPLLPGEMYAERFDRVCGWVSRWFNVLPLGEAVQRLQSGTLPARAIAITFDDGYADNLVVAAPILRRHGLSATFFIATAYLDGGRMFNDTVIETVRRTERQALDVSSLHLATVDRLPLATVAERRRAIDTLIDAVKYLDPPTRLRAVDELTRLGQVTPPSDLMMTRDQVRALSASGMQLGAHTRNHPILARLGVEEARAEIEGGKADLENIADRGIELFAYPNGRPGADYTPGSVQLVKSAGFRAAVSTAWGAASRGCDVFQLPRFTPWDRGALAFALRSMRNLRVRHR
jgi:peptidoglycan/xylan/chitin deacetylase (PgdA/CDA1 family)